MYKAALIGCGNRARAHIEAYDVIDDATVVACCAPSATRRDPLAAQFGLRAYSDPAAMIAAEQPDIVHVITWPDTRVALMSLVASLGVPLCTVEKPIAQGVDDWITLQELAAQATTRFGICHQLRWQENLVRCQRAVAAGEIGSVHMLDMSSGMNITGQGTHTLNYGRSLIGDPRVTHVFAGASGWDAWDPGHPGPESTEAALTFDNGVRGIWTSGPVSPRCGDASTTWQHVRAAAYGDAGLVEWQEFADWTVSGRSGMFTGRFDDAGKADENARAAQAGFHKAMFRWLEDPSAVPGTSLDTSLHEWAVVLALYQSSLEHAPVALDGFEPDSALVHRLRTVLTA